MAGEVQRRKRRLRPPPSRYQAFIDGDLSVEELDDEEIQRAQLRNSVGTFTGRPPQSIPREFMLVIQREQQRRFQQFINEAVPEAQKAVLQLIKSNNLMPGDATRLKAAELVLERFAGKTPDRVEVKAEVTKFEGIAADILIDIEEDEEEL